MVKQYPHTLQYISEETEPYLDSEGYWVEGTGTLEVVKCRAEPNSAGTLVNTADGQQVSFRYMVYFPKGTPKLKAGTEVKLFDKEELFAEETVLQFQKGQLNCRAWL